MKKVLVAIGAVAIGALLIPDEASAQSRRFGGMGGVHVGGGAWRSGMIGARSGFGYRAGYRPAFAGYGYRGVGYSGRRWAYGGYRPYYRGTYGYGGAVAAGLIGAAAVGGLGYYGYPSDAGYTYSNPSYDYPAYGSVVYESYPAGLTQPCFSGPGCRADGYPDARYYRGAYGY